MNDSAPNDINTDIIYINLRQDENLCDLSFILPELFH